MKGKKKCLCGCGTDIPFSDSKGREKFYVRGHINKGKNNIWSQKPNSKNKRTGRWRARLLIDVSLCTFKEKKCKGRIEVHHIDHDPMNNKKENLIALCKAHHNFFDRGILDKVNHKIPSFYIDKSGKRRYKKLSTGV